MVLAGAVSGVGRRSIVGATRARPATINVGLPGARGHRNGLSKADGRRSGRAGAPA